MQNGQTQACLRHLQISFISRETQPHMHFLPGGGEQAWPEESRNMTSVLQLKEPEISRAEFGLPRLKADGNAFEEGGSQHWKPKAPSYRSPFKRKNPR